MNQADTPPETVQQARSSVLRWAFAFGTAAAFIYLALITASWSEWSGIVDPAERWRVEQGRIVGFLVASWLVGAIGICLARLIIARSVVTWWLTLSLAVPLYEIWKLAERGIIPW